MHVFCLHDCFKNILDLFYYYLPLNMSTIFIFQTKWFFLLYSLHFVFIIPVMVDTVHFLRGKGWVIKVHSYIFKVRTTHSKIVSKCLLCPNPTLFFAVQMTFWFWKSFWQCDSSTFISATILPLPLLNLFL